MPTKLNAILSDRQVINLPPDFIPGAGLFYVDDNLKPFADMGAAEVVGGRGGLALDGGDDLFAGFGDGGGGAGLPLVGPSFGLRH